MDDKCIYRAWQGQRRRVVSGRFRAVLRRFVEFHCLTTFAVIAQHDDVGGKKRLFGGCGHKPGLFDGIFYSIQEGRRTPVLTPGLCTT